MSVLIFVASEEATLGSVIAKQERIFPSSSLRRKSEYLYLEGVLTTSPFVLENHIVLVPNIE